MGKLQLFEIQLADSRVIYGPGQPLAGAVTVRLAAPLPYRAIKVTCMGSCGVSNKINDTAWTVEEPYFNSTLSLADKGTLSAGEHTFPFQFLLPATAPTSFEGPFGKVIHQVRAVIDTPRFSKDYKCNKVFYILCPLNLNDIPDIEVRGLGRWVWEGTGSICLALLRQWGRLWEALDISRSLFLCVSVSLTPPRQKVSYKSKRWIYDLRTIAEVEGAAVKAWKHAEWREQILVPALPQSILQGCNLIHIDYYLQVSLKAPEVSVSLPLFIGNIAVNRVPVSPSRLPLPVLPSAPPEDEDADAAGGRPAMDSVSISTKSHSQQRPPPPPLGPAPGPSSPDPRLDPEPGGSPGRPPLCLSTGATVPYFADGTVVPVPTAGSLILPPEYSTWGYPYGEPAHSFVKFIRSYLSSAYCVQRAHKSRGGDRH
uniref:Arrestin domain containing 1 n=1 Tax=Ornithorhynchus anatinus TaxID=9258 RepID=F6V5D8_ORNAN